jgi:hypothetical protein
MCRWPAWTTDSCSQSAASGSAAGRPVPGRDSPPGELQRADRIKASHLDARPHRRSARTVSARWVASPCASAGPVAPGGCGACHASRARHQATSSRGGRGQSRPDGTDLAVIASRLGVAGTPRNRPHHGRAGTRGGQPDLHPQRDAGVSANDEQRSQPSGQIHRPRPSTLSRLARPGWLILGRRRPSAFARLV